MKFIADLHIHSHFSLATSKQLTPQYLDYWGKIKGVNVIGTGDFTHPGWTKELKEALEPAEEGLFKLKSNLILENPVKGKEVRFLLSAEISNIYKKNGKVRKIHNVVLAPDFETVEKIQKVLTEKKFNITSDGRPILGLDSKDLLEMLLEISEQIMFIPAHIWTPWFAVLGSKSGFDSIEECFEDLTGHIFAVETGLSSDQPLNWLCSFLDKFTLISNSDAHSPEKIGRNANIFDTELSYFAMKKALENQEDSGFVGTIDMYPQEGKYHYDGHRKCGIRWSPVETLKHNGICPVCGKPVTLGVAHRIAQLADRKDFRDRPVKKQFKYLIPLKEIIAEIFSVSPNSKSVDNQYFKLIGKLGSEFDILFETPPDDIRKAGGEILAEAIERMRQNRVYIEEGFDGQYGVIKLFAPEELKNFGSKKDIFNIKFEQRFQAPPERKLLNFDVDEFLRLKQSVNLKSAKKTQPKTAGFTPEQEKAIKTTGKNIFIQAGPGTGKTTVLTAHFIYLIENKQVKPENILAITFTNQATNEMKKRISEKLKNIPQETLQIHTFHAYALKILKDKLDNFIIVSEADKNFILREIGVPKNKIRKYANLISKTKNTLQSPIEEPDFEKYFEKYQAYLKKHNLLDLDEIVYRAADILTTDKNAREKFSKQYVLVDEFQDINPQQYEFLKLLVAPGGEIFAIGDKNQSVYEFRGSAPSLTDKFVNEFDAEKITLTQSFRCPENILLASGQVIDADKPLQGTEKGLKINISAHPTAKSEAEFIARTIEKLIGGVRFFSLDSKITDGYDETEFESLSDFAVLTRTKQQFDLLTEAFNNHGLPYLVIGDLPFYFEEPFDIIIDFLKFAYIGENEFIARKIKDYVSYVKFFKTDNIEEFLRKVWDKFFAEKFKDSAQNFERFVSLAKNFGSIKDFIDYIDLSKTSDDLTQTDAVRLMTLHASKGLEFKCVFIAGCEDGIIPYTLYNPDVNIAEEQRLFYVGMTRSKKFLYLTYAQQRNWQKRNLKLPKSRFLDKIEQDLLKFEKQQKFKKSKKEHPKLF